MASSPRTASRKPARAQVIHKPLGTIHPRVQAVGPEHFGIVSVDCAKARSKWMLADFYGRVLVPPTVVEHTRAGLQAMVRRRSARPSPGHGIADLIVAIERTGRYHLPVQRAFDTAGFEVRIVHPLDHQAVPPARRPGQQDRRHRPGRHPPRRGQRLRPARAPAEPDYARLQLLARHRRDLVDKAVGAPLPDPRASQYDHAGICRLFDDIFDGQGAAPDRQGARIGRRDPRRRPGRPDRAAPREPASGPTGRPWRGSSPGPARPPMPPTNLRLHHKIMKDLDDDRLAKRADITAIEAELAGLLARTPYVLLLGIPGINVVSAAEFAGEMGPIKHYRSSRAITGRAGMYPSRYQSDAVDRPDGQLVRRANRRLRRAIMMIADNLIDHNDHFRILAAGWELEGKDPRDIRVRVAGRFCRIAYQVVAGRATYRHPSGRGHDYVLRKLMRFGMEHGIDLREVMKVLEAATGQLPDVAHGEEAEALQGEINELQKKRGSGVRTLGQILPAVLVKLGVKLIQSEGSGEVDRT